MGLIDRFIKWAASVPKGKKIALSKGKPYLMPEKDIPLDEIFGLPKKKEKEDN